MRAVCEPLPAESVLNDGSKSAVHRYGASTYVLLALRPGQSLTSRAGQRCLALSSIRSSHRRWYHLDEWMSEHQAELWSKYTSLRSQRPRSDSGDLQPPARTGLLKASSLIISLSLHLIARVRIEVINFSPQPRDGHGRGLV